jgi:hypothetical protein
MEKFRCQCQGGGDLCACHVYGTTVDCQRCTIDILRKDALSDKDLRRERYRRRRNGA